MIGIMKNSPGPLSDRNLPNRNTTAFSHWSAILIIRETNRARKNAITPIHMLAMLTALFDTRYAKPKPTPKITIKTKPAKELLLVIPITSTSKVNKINA